MISSVYLSTFTVKVGSYLWNFANAFWNFDAPSCLAGLIVRLITGSGTNILCDFMIFDISPSVRVSPVEHSTPNIAKISPALTSSIYSISLACIFTIRLTFTFFPIVSFQTKAPFLSCP